MIGTGIGFTFGGQPSAIQRALSVLRKFGTNAHAYIPGGSISTYGPELVTNGGFGSGSTGWTTFQAGWSASSGTASVNSAAAGGTYVRQGTAVVGKRYMLIFDVVSITSGSLVPVVGGAFATAITSAGIGLVVYITATDTTGFGILATSTNTVATIDNISVKEVLTTTSVVLNGLTAGNYTDTAGTQFTTKDQPVGLDLDAMGSLGAELVTNGGFDDATGWTLTQPTSGIVTISGGVCTIMSTDGSWCKASRSITPTVIGRTYKYVITVESPTVNGVKIEIGGAEVVFITPGVKTGHVVAIAVGSTITVGRGGISAGSGAVVDNISVKEVTGIHATQGTAGNKPVLRQGPVNMLLYSNDFSNATSWPKTGTTALISTTTAPDGTFAYAIAETSAAGAHRTQQTLATSVAAHTVSIYAKAATRNWLLILMSGSVNVGRFFDLSAGVLGSTYSGAPTNSLITDAGGGWYKCQITFTSTVAPVLQLYLSTDGTSISYAGNSSEAIYIWNSQFQLGSTATTYIPTTSAKASAGTGPSYWEFGGDGTPTDYLSLGSVPFQMSDDFAFVCAFLCTDAIAAQRFIVSAYEDTNNYVGIYVHTTGQVRFVTKADAGTTAVTLTSPATFVGSVCIVTGVKRGNTKILRINGVESQSSSTPSGSATFVASQIGAKLGAYPFAGNKYCDFLVKGTITDADLLLIEKLAANLAGITLA